MASSSSSSIMADASKFDVFLSFRGEDTRYNFTDHLYKRLMTAGIFTFRDEEDIKRGEEVKPEIEKAIKESKASIVVLSQNYATSTWCLDELVLILQKRKEGNHFVLPVFYHVDPSNVGKQNKTFALQVKESSLRWTDQNVKLWKEALMEVAGLAGEVLSRLKNNPFLNQRHNHLRHLLQLASLPIISGHFCKSPQRKRKEKK
ncbi:unnamed protein product [Lactuca virosa]|uniref:TIR domain-containing protein n=1 Tax=Lactuca virosa TaxID=75947 RepID=A0AAU9PGJ6_9ASTR|nr:unnamed protein product [Lactuca virosa]